MLSATVGFVFVAYVVHVKYVFLPWALALSPDGLSAFLVLHVLVALFVVSMHQTAASDPGIVRWDSMGRFTFVGEAASDVLTSLCLVPSAFMTKSNAS